MMLVKNNKTERSETMEKIMIVKMTKAAWNKLDKMTKMAVACIAWYLLLYVVVDVVMSIGRFIVLYLM